MFHFITSLFLGVSMMFSGLGHTTANLVSQITTGHSTSSSAQVMLTQDQVDAMGGSMYADGNLPLGDNKYTTDNPKQGYIYLCNVPQGNGGGAQESGSWLGTSTWTYTNKPKVEGSVVWSNATFSNTISGDTRTLTGNGLPVGMSTGIFPIASTDPAYQYDRNPNSIKTQTLDLSLPVSPTYSDTPNCMGMEVGVMLNGVPLFNAFDAELRDAPAHEAQDSCDGHPQEGGEYHYHSMSSCFSDTSETTVLGFALDGFPITGSNLSNGKYLTTANLDVCHGITSPIMLDGKEVTMYHYVMTQDFPYSVSCFRGKPVSFQVIATNQNGQSLGQSGQGGQQVGQNGQMRRPSGVMPSGMPEHGINPLPPTQAFSVCSGKTVGTSCSFSGISGTIITGTCQMPPGQTSLVCVTEMQPMTGNGGPIRQ